MSKIFETMTKEEAIEYCYKHENEFKSDCYSVSENGERMFECLIGILEDRTIKPRIPDIELGFILSQTDAESLNKKEKWLHAPDYRFHYDKGGWSTKFDTPEQVIHTGIIYYENNLKKDWEILVLGDSSVVEPQKIIANNFTEKKQLKLVSEINKIYKHWLPYWDADNDAGRERWWQKWMPVWKELTGEVWS